MRTLFEAISDTDEKVSARSREIPYIWLKDTFGVKDDDMHEVDKGMYSIYVTNKKIVIDNTYGHSKIIFSLHSRFRSNAKILIRNANAFYNLFAYPRSSSFYDTIEDDITLIYDTDEALSINNIPSCAGTVIVKKCKSFAFPTGVDSLKIKNLILHKKGIGIIYGINGIKDTQSLTIKD